jgi:hypothetical protein
MKPGHWQRTDGDGWRGDRHDRDDDRGRGRGRGKHDRD